MVWDTWETVFHDSTAKMTLYDLVGGGVLEVRDNVVYLGSTEIKNIRRRPAVCESFLRLRLPNRYKDVDVTVKLEILNTAKNNDDIEDFSHWFGITTRAVRANHWDAYLFYIRRDGRVEFGIRGGAIEKQPPVTLVSSQAVTIRIMVEGDHIQTWVNNKPYHDWRDKQKEFIKGKIQK